VLTLHGLCLYKLYLSCFIDSEPERSPEAVFIPEPESNGELIQVCLLATASVIDGVFVEFVGLK